MLKNFKGITGFDISVPEGPELLLLNTPRNVQALTLNRLTLILYFNSTRIYQIDNFMLTLSKRENTANTLL